MIAALLPTDPRSRRGHGLAHVRRGATLWLARHSVDVLRVSLGLIFLGFGVLKFVPGLSPAEGLVVQTLGALSFGLVPPTAALLLTAVMETFIGLTLVTGRWLVAGLIALAGALFGILSPVVLFASEMFGGGPTLEAQYVLKDVVLAAVALVLAASALGARLVADGEPR